MAIYEFKQSGISALTPVTFSSAGLHERRDLQRLLREHVEVIAPETLVIAEEFGEWEDARRRIDLLAVDKAANLVVIELKRNEDGGYMDLQAVRYASMVSTMTFEKAADAFGRYLTKMGKNGDDARITILDFLGWEEPDEDQFAQEVRIVLAAAEFSKELTSSVMWLNDHNLDIRCVRLKPYLWESRVVVDVQQIIPLPESAEYQVQIREKVRKELEARTSQADFTRFDIEIEGQRHVSMWKRNAIFLIVKRLCDKGITPDDITILFDWRPNRVWYVIDKQVSAFVFEQLAGEKAASGGPSFNPRRWFCEDGQLVQANGKTYAFSSQWGGQNWHRAMQVLRDAYPAFKISFFAHEDGVAT